MNRNTKLVAGVVGGLVIGFGAGYIMPHGSVAARATGAGQFTGAQFAGRMGARGDRGATVGSVVSQSGGTLTVKSADGSTELVLMGTSTQIFKTGAGSLADLTAGTNVVVAGVSNSDGSITAQSVQIRPAGMMPARTTSAQAQ